MYSLVSIIATLSSRLREFYFISVCFAFSSRVAFINSAQAIAVQFSTFCSSTLPFQLVFKNLSKKLIICSQHLDVLNDIESTVQLPWSLKEKPNLSPYIYDYPNTLLFETLEFSGNSRFCWKSDVNVFPLLIYPYLL